jgi:hypothetical protein
LHTAWQFCNDLGLVLEDTLPTLQLKRRYDQFLMQAFLENGYGKKQLKLLNLCRVWARVTTLSDITTGDGRHLQNQFRQGIGQSLRHQKQWPTAAAPDNHCWALWRRALDYCFLRPDDHHHRLRVTLGDWIVAPECDWYYSHISDTVFEFSGEDWIHRDRNPSNRPVRFQGFRRTTRRTLTVPDDALPTSVYGTQIIHIQGTQNINIPEPDEEAPQWWNEIVNLPTDPQALIDGIRNNTAVCVTDGSYKHTYGAAALIILPSLLATDGVVLVHQTPGLKNEMDPYRAELGGIYGCLAYVKEFAKTHRILSGGITLACDCWSALLNVFKHTRDTPNQPQFDLVHSCRLLIHNSSVAWLSRHVRGHQDDHTSFDELDRWGQLNVEMDILAKRHREHIEAEQRPDFGLPPQLDWSLWHGEHRITSWSDTTALQLLYSGPAKTFWKKKLRMVDTAPEPNWSSTHNAFQNIPTYKKIWMIKYLTNRLPIGAKLLQWKFTTNDLCPRCGQPEQHRGHVLQCPHLEAVALWDKALEDLSHWMITHHTQPDAQRIILANLRSWHDDNGPITITVDWPGLHDTNRQQNDLGWRHFHDGFLVSGWAAIQQAYYDFLGKRHTGRRWASQLIRRLWTTSWDLWRHRMKIINTPDNVSRINHTALVDQQIQERYDSYHHDPQIELRRWFSQELPTIQNETLDFKEQWLQLVDTAFTYYY